MKTLANNSSFVNPPPPLLGKLWDSWAKAGAITFLLPLQCRGNDRVFMFRSLPQGDFLLRQAGQRALF